ncbi:hypothetical protein IEQ34_026954 [Dendrobium chrysotoxum]|uniref:Uncharacterized protein n=1 Tax=Dendrobium chrysotoxum TaxID=161865 RepID=A0AAV7FI98_DENCH|nr:hypothetical protein IEQ34_026954 [Dendrobium chrysotoxum]
MLECLDKLSSIENISSDAIIAVQETLIENSDNKITLMTLDGHLLSNWIEHVNMSLAGILDFVHHQLGCHDCYKNRTLFNASFVILALICCISCAYVH